MPGTGQMWIKWSYGEGESKVEKREKGLDLIPYAVRPMGFIRVSCPFLRNHIVFT